MQIDAISVHLATRCDWILLVGSGDRAARNHIRSNSVVGIDACARACRNQLIRHFDTGTDA
jgi:hypothetical protein